jgi:ubiquinone/menaquinone biosynthesis C-methylase UbiE
MAINMENYSKIIEDPLSDINWSHYWKKGLLELPESNGSKDWDNIAPKFKKWMEKDDYPEKLLDKIKTSPNYSVLDIGCGEGVITVPLAKMVSKVTGVDLSSKMLGFLKQRAVKEGVYNLNLIQGDLINISEDSIGKVDVVIASRCLNGIIDIETVLKRINKIGKYVYITLRCSDALKSEKVFNILNRKYPQYPSYIYVYNLLYQMGITANVEKLECETVNIYENVEEALDRYRWKIGDLNPAEEKIMRGHLNEILIDNGDGTLINPYENPDWILIWWRND